MTQQTPTIFGGGDATRSRNVGSVNYFCKVKFEGVGRGCEDWRHIVLVRVDENVFNLSECKKVPPQERCSRGQTRCASVLE